MVDAGMHSHARAWEREQGFVGMSCWSNVSLDTLCYKITDGSHNPPKGIEDSAYLMLSSKNIFHDEIHFEKPRFLSQEDFEQENKRTDVCVNDVLLTIVGTVGRAAVVLKEHPKFVLQRSVAVLKPVVDSVTPRFLMYSLRSLSNVLAEEARGVAQKGIYLRQIRDLQIPLPPLAEQKKIAAILDAADRLRKKDAQLIAKYNELSQSLFLDMFGDPVTNPMGWDEKSLGAVCNKVTDGTHQSPKFLSAGIPFLLVSNIVNNDIMYETKKFISEKEYNQLTKNTPIEVGDILYTSVGSYGNPAIVEDDRKFCFQRHIAHIKTNLLLVNVKFMREMLLTAFVKRQADKFARGAAQKTLNLKDIKSLKILLPPIILQNQFAERIQHIEAQKQQAQAALQKSDDLFHSLLQRAFKGELTEQSKTEGL